MAYWLYRISDRFGTSLALYREDAIGKSSRRVRVTKLARYATYLEAFAALDRILNRIGAYKDRKAPEAEGCRKLPPPPLIPEGADASPQLDSSH